MEVVALNEQLREEFAGVVKHFLTIRRDEITRVASAGGAGLTDALAALQSKQKSPQETQPSDAVETKHADENGEFTQPDAEPNAGKKPGDEQAPPSLATEKGAAAVDADAAKALQRTQQYAAQAQAILRRVNMYQYQTRVQFGEDVAVLLELADSNDQKLMLRHLVDQQHALMTPRARDPSAKRRKVNGIRVDTVGILGLQQRTETKWVCNMNLVVGPSTLTTPSSREEALEQYVKLRKQLQASPMGMKVLEDAARVLGKTRATFDSEVLRAAMNQVKHRLPIPKHYDVAGLAAALTPHPQPQAQTQTPAAPQPASTLVSVPVATVNGSGKEKETKASRKRELAVVTTMPRANAATPGLSASTMPTGQHSRMSNLSLRRLVQMKLCRHLEGREVCARKNEADEVDSWKPSGKLERGKVFSYSTKRLVTFSDFVVATLKKSVAACAHIYLIESRETIDAHLLVCEEFSDHVRENLPERFKEISEKYVEGKLKHFK